MSKELDTDTLNRFLKMLLDGLEQGKDFVNEQAPLAVQELIAWKRFWFTALCVASLLLSLAAWKLAWFFKDKFDKKPAFDRDAEGIGTTFSFITSAVSLLVFFPMSVYWASMVWFAPRLYVIEYITSMVRGK